MHTKTSILQALSIGGVHYVLNETLAKHVTFKIGGPATIFASPKNTKQLICTLNAAKKFNMPHFLLGRGSNVLFEDEGFNGLVIHVESGFDEIAVKDTTITAGAGAELAKVCKIARDASLSGLEFAYGIPGSVGGAVFMNAGAFNGETRFVLKSVNYLDENCRVQQISVQLLNLGYRQSAFQANNWCLLNATYCLQKGSKAEINEQMQKYIKHRTLKQPLDLPSAGSAFKRPLGAYAGALIDQCGLRGYRVGDAAISEKHCGFIVNLGSATSKQVLQLANYVAKTVLEETGYVLEKEIRVITANGERT